MTRLRSHAGARRDFKLAVDRYIAEADKPSAARFVEDVEYLLASVVAQALGEAMLIFICADRRRKRRLRCHPFSKI